MLYLNACIKLNSNMLLKALVKPHAGHSILNMLLKKHGIFNPYISKI